MTLSPLFRGSLFALSLAFVCTGLLAQTPTVKPETPAKKPAVKLPSAEKVLARFITASGGAEKLGKIETMRQTLTIDIPMLGSKTMDIVSKKRVLDAGTKKERVVFAYHGSVDFGEGLGLAREGSDGTHTWDIQPMQGPRLLEGAELAAKVRSIDPLAYHHWKRYYRGMKTLAREKIGAESCLKVEMTPKIGSKELAWFSEKTGLLLQTQGKLETAMGELPIKTTMSDYRPIKPLDVLQAFTVVVEIEGMGAPRKVKLKTAIMNAPVKDSEVALPAEIVKILEKKRKKQAEKETGAR